MTATLLVVLAMGMAVQAQTDTAPTVCEYRYAFSRGIVPVYRALRVDAEGWVHAVDRRALPARGSDSTRRAKGAKAAPLLRLSPERLNEVKRTVRDAERGELRETREPHRFPRGSTIYRCFRPGSAEVGAQLVVLKEVTDTSRSENTSPAAIRLTQWLDSLRTLAAAARRQ